MTRIALRLAAYLYRAYYATLRVACLLPDDRVIPAADHPLRGQIFALCERDVPALAGLMAGNRFVVLVAHGRDGDWASEMLACIGCRVVRGSTRRGGVRALLALMHTLEASDDPIGLVVDGPLGPAGIAKPGAVICGMKSTRPVRALGVAARWKITLPGTWSGMYVPLPFSPLIVTYAPQLDFTGAEVGMLTQRLTEHLSFARERATEALDGRRGVPCPS